jgi:GT2 family glycosyltransferase
VSRSDVSIVIPTWNGRHLLERFLPSVVEAARQHAIGTGAAVEIVVVDDGSTDGSLAWIESRAGACSIPLRAVRLDRNMGFVVACNRGVGAASHPLIFLLNNDVEVARDVLSRLVRAIHRGIPEGPLLAVHCRAVDVATGRDVGTGKTGRFARGFLRVHRSYAAIDSPASHDTAPAAREPSSAPSYPSMFAGGGSALFDRTRFLELGGFDELFAPFYLEDVELSYRAWKRGLAVGYEPHSIVRHQFSSTIGQLAGTRIARVSHRNRLLLHWIHLHDPVWFLLHLGWAALLAFTAPLAFKPHLLLGTIDALGRLPTILKRRRAERAAAVRTDRQVLAVFRALEMRPDVRPYDDPRELETASG